MFRKVCLATLVAFFGIGSHLANAQIKVGITIGTSGASASLGQPMLKTIPILPKEMGGQKVTYVLLDDESVPTRATQNARKLVSEEKVDVLIGSSGTPTTIPLVDVAAESKTPLFALGAATVLVAPVDDKRRWVFKVVPPDEMMAKVILNHIAKSGVKTIGYIGTSDAYGETYFTELSRLAPEVGVTLTTHEVYARSDTSVTGQVLKILATKPDVVFIASPGTAAVLPNKALRERGYKGPIYGTSGVALQEFIKLGGKDVEGVTFAGGAFPIAAYLPEDNVLKKPAMEFIKKYEEGTKEQASLFGAILYDSVQLLNRAVPGALKVARPGTPEFRAAIRDEVERTKDLPLISGLASMSATDHSGYDERSAFLIQVRDGGFRLLK